MQGILYKFILLISGGYLLLLLAWAAIYAVSGDSHGFVAGLNWLAQYLFLPLPVVLLAALGCRSRWLGIGAAAGVLAFLLLFGELFLPRRAAVNEQPVLSVLTYNVLAYHTYTGPIIATIRAEDADIVMIQELNYFLADELRNQLSGVYPFQYLEPVNNPTGIGIISKYPLIPTQETLPHKTWVGGPQIFDMDWQGEQIRLVNFHFRPTTRLTAPELMARSFRDREEQAQLILDLARRSGPVIAAGDANSGHLSDARRILLQDLRDAWSTAGFGLGHTFPGSAIPGSSRPSVGGMLVPSWLVRIDYVFYSDHWEVTEARLARFDGVSDHRGVIAVLRRK